ncbi:sigma-54-dependent Fis family transcriptional regulator [candidate division WOR-3 bacterium]|nr:sigma-54-dependent Fis family transcriptional regulator [candidate division WOR-3 bacterium]
MVLVVDDDVNLSRVIAGLLEKTGYRVERFDSGEALLERLEQDATGLVLLDFVLPGIDGVETLRRIKESRPGLPVVMMSGKGTVKAAVEALKLGAYDFLEKPLDADRLRVTVRNALEVGELRRQVEVLKQELGDEYRLVGDSAPMRRVRELAERVARADVGVLVTGESGAGKEVVAWTIHRLSPRAGRPFVALNCAAIPRELIESELFGHARGAFTGADRDRAGKLHQADRGTLFLDEVGDMSTATQAKLLRFLESSEVQRLGESETRRLDVRVLAATNKDLKAAIAAGEFREDLLHRLNVVSIEVPPLRERVDDIPALVALFRDRYAVKHARPGFEFGPGCLELLRGYDWPGNVRELRNLVERAVVLARTDPMEPEELRTLLPAGPAGLSDGSLGSALAAAERETVERALDRYGGNVSQAARVLGVERQSLYRIMKRHGIEPDRNHSDNN